MRKYLTILLFLTLLSSTAFSQTVNINDIQHQQNIIANCDLSIASCQATITTAEANVAIDNAAIAAYNASIAQTAAQVNWESINNLELAGIRYASSQWQAVYPGINWPSIVPTLGVLGVCSVSESSVNWSNFDSCENAGVVMGQPYGNWPTGIGAFWCGHGSIAGTC